jgi:alkanesulfonate monooxygenase SsuD/methylene tetrahydromethanopterin reductase-like flavin-dependent oxidoreductase (luciferase family)
MDAESRALGVAPEERRKRMYEHIRVLKHLWYNDRAEFKGSFHSFADLVLEPKPVNPNCPIWTATNATRLASGATNAASSGSDYALKQCGRLGGRVDDARCLTARHIRLVGPDTGGG